MLQPAIVHISQPSGEDINRVRSLMGADDSVSDDICRRFFYRGFARAVCADPDAKLETRWAAVATEIESVRAA